MIEQFIDRYIKLRDKKAEMKAAFDISVGKIDEAMQKVENVILEHLNNTGTNSVGSDSGTAFKQQMTSATVGDRDAFINYVRTNDAYTLLDVRANKTAITEFKEANNDLPPGVVWREETVVRIRRATNPTTKETV